MISEKPLAQRRELIEKVKYEALASSEDAIQDLFEEEKLLQKKPAPTPVSIDDIAAKVAKATAEFDAKHTPHATKEQLKETTEENKEEINPQPTVALNTIRLPPQLLSPAQICFLLRTVLLILLSLCGAYLHLPPAPLHSEARAALLNSIGHRDSYEVQDEPLIVVTYIGTEPSITCSWNCYDMLQRASCCSYLSHSCIAALATRCRNTSPQVTALQGTRGHNFRLGHYQFVRYVIKLFLLSAQLYRYF